MADWDKDWQDLSNKPMGVIQDKKYKAYLGRDEILKAMSGLLKGTTTQTGCDPADSPRGSKATDKDNMVIRNTKFSANLVPFKRDINNMVAALKKMLATTPKATEPELYRYLKILITGSEAFLARMQQHAKTWAANAKDTKSYDKVQEIEDPNDKKAASEARALKIELRDLKAKLNATIKKAIATAQRIKADPTPANYNTEIDKGGRDLYMTLVAIRKVKSDPKLGKTSEAKEIPDPGSFVDDMKQFGESAGTYRKLADTATTQNVLAVLKTFSQTVKGIALDNAKFLKS